MKKRSLIVTLAAGLLCLVALASCGDEPGETTDTGETGTGVVDTTEDTADPSATDETDTEGEPEETTEAVTRYDYFAAEVLPDVTLDKSAYEAMTLKLSPDLLITDEEVADYIDYLRFQERTADNDEAKMTDQPMKLGDTAYIYYRGTVDGEEFEGGSNMDDEEPYELGLGSGALIPGFEEGLVGVIPNQTSEENPAEIHVTFPESYSSKELAGKDAVFYVVVEHAVQYTMPEYTRDFVENTLKYVAEKVHVTDGSFLAEFEEYMKEYLEEKNADYIESAKTDALWTYLTGIAVCSNMPASEIQYYTESYINELEAAYEYYSAKEGFTDIYDTVDKFAVVYMGFEEGADWKAEVARLAELMVKKDMIIHAIGEREGMEIVTDEEMQEEIDYWIEYYGGYVTEDDILENIGEAYLRESAYAVKMYDYLMEHATFVYEADTDTAE